MKISPFVLLFLILCESFLVQYNQPSLPPSNVKSHATKSITPTLIRSSLDWLGYYIRGKDQVSVSGQLVDKSSGEPIPNADLEVYLVFNSGDSIFLGTYKTDSNGYFSISFPVKQSYPIGNATLLIHYPGNPLQGYGPTNKTYDLTILGRLFVSIRLSKKQLASFEKHVIITATLIMDNGTMLRAHSVNITFYVEYNLSVERFDVSTDLDGSAILVYNFSAEGTYNITAEFLYNGSNYNLIVSQFPSARYLIAEKQFVINQTEISGVPISTDYDSFTVLWACVINAKANGTLRLRVPRNNTIVVISGSYLNATGYPESTLLNLTILGENLNTYYLINTSSDGSFTFYLNITPKFPAGVYMIIINDTDPSTHDISTSLTLEVYTILSLIEFNVSPHYVKTGDVVNVSGRVIDLFSSEPIGNISVVVSIRNLIAIFFQNTTMTDSYGYFHVDIPIPDDFADPTAIIEVSILSPDRRLYQTENYTTQIMVWSFLTAIVRVNNTSLVWGLIDNAVVAYNTTYQLEFHTESTTLIVNITVCDNFYRLFNRSITCRLTVNDISQEIILSLPSSVILFLNKTSNLTITLNIPYDSENYTYSMYVYILLIPPEETPTPQADSRPIFIALLVIFILAIISSYLRATVRKPKKKILKIGVIGHIVNDIRGRNWDKVALGILELCQKLGKIVDINWLPWMTFREFCQEISKKTPRNVALALQVLVEVYEKIVFGERTLSEVESRMLLRALEVIRAWILELSKLGEKK